MELWALNEAVNIDLSRGCWKAGQTSGSLEMNCALAISKTRDLDF
jgi:hypothetical protein